MVMTVNKINRMLKRRKSTSELHQLFLKQTLEKSIESLQSGTKECPEFQRAAGNRRILRVSKKTRKNEMFGKLVRKAENIVNETFY